MKRITVYLLSCLLFLQALPAHSQSIACPEIHITGVPSLRFNCVTGTQCTTLTATMPDIRNTNDYIVTSTNYNDHFAYQITGATPVLVNIDDRYSGAINLPFNFCFYGNTYNQVVVGANGVLSFNTTYANGQCRYEMCSAGGTPYVLPTNTMDRNAIFACFHDIDPSKSATNKGIEYALIGTAPCRKLVVNYRNIPQYRNPTSSENCNLYLSTFQVVLYENTNVIEVYIKDKPICTTWNCGGLATVGLQNAGANLAITAPGRNAALWGGNDINEAWRFIPNGTSLLNNAQLLLNGTVVTTGTVTNAGAGLLSASFSNVCISTDSVKYIVRANYTSCSGVPLAPTDSIMLYRTLKPDPPVVTTPVDYCINSPVSPLSATGSNLLWYTSATGGTGTATAPTPSSATTGTFTWYVSQTVNNCESDRAAINVVVHPYPVIAITPPAPIAICAGQSISLTASGGTTYTWSPATGLNTTTGATVSASPSGTVTYTVTGSNGYCGGTATRQVTVNPLPNIAITPANATICAGRSTTLTASGGNSYTWSPATGLNTTTGSTVNASPSATTTYTVTGTDANSCSNTANATITIIPVVTNTVSAQICQGQSYSFGNTVLTTTGTYTRTFTAANTCDSTVTLTLQVIQPVTNTIAVTICPGSSYNFGGNSYSTSGSYQHTFTAASGCDSVVTLNLSVRTAIATNVNAGICTGSSYNFAGTALTTAGSYTHTFTSVQGCDSVVNLTLTVYVLPVITVSPANPVICAGQGIPLTANGATSYSWSPATGLSATTGTTVTASPASTTTYLVTGTDANNCSNTATKTVTVNQLPVLSVTPANAAICIGQNITLTASGAAGYTWVPGATLNTTTGATVIATPAATTTYTITGTDANSCTNTITKTVTVNQLPVISVAPATATICAGQSITLTASGATGYSWSPATGLNTTTGSTVIANPATTTTYTITGTDANSCSNTAAKTVTVNPLPAVTVSGSATICLGASATFTAAGAASYSWSPATGLNATTGSTVIATPAATTTYTVTGTTNGCSRTATVTATLFPHNSITINGAHAICRGDSINLTAGGAGTGGSYLWSPATGLSTTSGSSVRAFPQSNTIYKVVGTDMNGCKDSAMATIVVNALPVMSISGTSTICKGQSAVLTAAGAGTGGTYTWTPVSGLNTGSGISVTATPNDTIVYQVVGVNTAGCRDSARIQVNVKPLPLIHAVPVNPVCKGVSVQMNATGGQSYTWSPSTGLSNTQIANPVAAPGQTTTYTVTGTGSNGCSKIDTVTLVINQPPVIQITGDTSLCIGSGTQLTASGAQTYQWSPATGLSNATIADPIASPTQNTTYTATGTNGQGCSDSAHISITVIQRIPTSVDTGADICEGSHFQLNASGGQSYLWTPANTLSNAQIANPVAGPGTTTTYTVYIKENECFTDTLHVTVRVHPVPDINFSGSSITLYLGNSTVLDPQITNASIYTWTPATGLSCTDCPAPTASPTRTTTYTLVASNEWGCSNSKNVLVDVICDNGVVFLPNTFTPNGDGVNDFFYPHGKAISTIKRFRIYDRWGELVFDVQNVPANDAHYGWDGRYKGRELPPDTYIYVLDAACDIGSPIQLKGDINLIR